MLEILRQPRVDTKVIISHAVHSFTCLANFILVAAMNLYACSYYAGTEQTCSFTTLQIQRYRSSISGLLLDRINIHFEVPTWIRSIILN